VVSIRSSPPMTVRNDTALRKNAHGSPSVVMRMPATAGPTTLPAFCTMLFSATALVRWSRPTISTTNVCRVGLSIASIEPSTSASTSTIQIRALCVSVSTPRHSAGRIASAWVQSRIFRLSTRSASRPPQGVSSRLGSCWIAVVRPSTTPEFVSSRTSQAWLTFCIQVPITEMDWPAK
jgi:hypothetical protein